MTPASSPLDAIQALLRKQRREQSVVHNQQLPRQAVAEILVQRQHQAELHKVLAAMAPADLGQVLEALPQDEALMLWAHIPPQRHNDVLWELGDERRQLLAPDVEPQFHDGHMHAYVLVNGRLQPQTIQSRRQLMDIKPIWIDLLGTQAAQRRCIGAHFGLEIPDPADLTDLESSSRYRVEDNGEIHLHANFLLDRAGQSRSVPVAFILHKGTLFSVRDEELPVFRLQRRRVRTQPGYVNDCTDVLLDLFGADVESSAEALESIYSTLGKVGRQVLSETISDREAAAILGDIAEEEDLNGRIRGNILDAQRAIQFLLRSKTLTPAQQDEAQQVLRNIDSLTSHTSFLFEKINFLMDATVGFVNINQNNRINQLTVLSVVFTPINILAGMGGMSEFSEMTRGIPMALSYSGFLLGAGFIGAMTYLALKRWELRQLRARKASIQAKQG